MREVGILVFVDKYITEKLLIVPTHIRVVAQQHIGIIQQVIEIHRACHKTAVAVDSVDFVCQRTPGTPVGFGNIFVGCIPFRAYKGVLGH